MMHYKKERILLPIQMINNRLLVFLLLQQLGSICHLTLYLWGKYHPRVASPDGWDHMARQ